MILPMNQILLTYEYVNVVAVVDRLIYDMKLVVLNFEPCEHSNAVCLACYQG